MSLVQRLCRCAVLGGALPFIVLTATAVAQDLTWIRQLGTVSRDYAWAAAPDGAGGVYVSGNTLGRSPAPNRREVWIARYNRAGHLNWVRFLGSSEDDYALAAASDGVDGVYVCGETYGDLGGPNAAVSGDAWIARYDRAGNQIWIRQLGTGGSSVSRDRARAAASDGAGGVYVCGSTEGDIAGPHVGIWGRDAWIARYDEAGNQTWIRQLGTSRDDYASAAAPDGAGGVYVSGNTTGRSGATWPDWDAWIARYDGAGNLAWVIRFLGTSADDYAYAAASDGVGGVYLCGATGGDLGGPNAGVGLDAWIARYDGAGNQTWIRQLGVGGPPGLGDVASAAAPDGAGGVYVSGYTSGSLGGPNAGATDAWIARFDEAGNQTWNRQLGSSEVDLALAAAPDGVGGLFLAGMTEGSLAAANATPPGSVAYEDVWIARYDGAPIAVRYCTPGVVNSTTLSASLSAVGDNGALANDLIIAAGQLPKDSFGYFLTSQVQDVVPASGGSQGTLCLGGAIGRFISAGQVLNSGAVGSFSLTVDLMSMPQPSGAVAVQPGDTWNFQAWYRDANPTSTTNFTDAVSVTFF